MTQEELSKLANIRKEIDIIKRQIANTSPSYVFDKVSGSDPEYPYTQRSFTLFGYDYDRYYAKLRSLQKKLEKMLENLISEQERIMDYINTVDDEVDRQILICKYVDCMTWEQMGNQIGYSGRQLKRIHTKIFQKQKDVPPCPV